MRADRLDADDEADTAKASSGRKRAGGQNHGSKI